MNIKKLAAVFAWLLGTVGGLAGLYVFVQEWVITPPTIQLIEFRSESKAGTERAVLKVRFTNNSDQFDKLHSILFWGKGGARLPEDLPWSCSPDQYETMVAPGGSLDYICATAWLPFPDKTGEERESIFVSDPSMKVIERTCFFSVIFSSKLGLIQPDKLSLGDFNKNSKYC